MKPDEDDQPGDGFERTLGGLEQLAGELDARKYPGKAWTSTRGVRSHWMAWKIAASIAGIAALVALAFHSWHTSPGHVGPAPGPTIIASLPASTPIAPSDESNIPRIVIVEDMDTYSIVDLTNGRPLVSFARKDSPTLDDVTPVLLDAPLDTGL